MEGAKAFFDQQIAEGSWSPRNVGWFRINLEQDPDFAISDVFEAD